MCRLYNSFRLVIAAALVSLVLSIISCKKFIEIDPPITSTNSANVYASDATATAVLTGMYINISSGGLSSNSFVSLTFYSGLSSDEFKLFSGSSNPTYIAYYKNQLVASGSGFFPWNTIYPYIFICNSAIEGLTNSNSLTPAVKQQLLGEAKFMRAFFYFQLVNLYGDVPLALSKDYKVNASLSRSPKSEVYKQIISDLKEAKVLLSQNYLDGDARTPYNVGSEERIRPTKWAATAMLARAYLFSGDYVNAEISASEIISNTTLFGPISSIGLNSVFLRNSKEAIWQLQPVNNGRNTEDAFFFILRSSGPSNGFPVSLSDNLMNAFEPGDLRRFNRNWIDSVKVGNPAVTYFFPYKYKSATQGAPVTEYLMVLRLAEQYLIRAEARAQLNTNISGAQSDLNAIRTRAGLPNTTANDKASLLTAILHERQTELFSEWDHRWLDLKRTGNVDAIMNIVTPQKGGIWNTNWQWYPIPAYELLRNPKLIQNGGY